MSTGEVTTGPREQETARRDRTDLVTLAILGRQLAHEFNELLVGVVGNAALARGKLDETSPAYPHVADVEACALRAGELVRTLVRYCGAPSVERSVAQGVVRVEDVVRAAAAESGQAARIRVRTGPAAGDVRGSASQLRHLFGSLIANALDATAGAADPVRISVGETHVHGPVTGASGRRLPAGRYVAVGVEDAGHGMDADVRPRVFEPGFSTRRAARGLGLTAARRIAAVHRGSIEIESEPGRGTRVRVLLPVHGAAAEPEVRAPAAPRRCLVLVVDDEESVRSVARALLEAAGHEVLVAAGGLEALDVFRAHAGEIDVVLLDRNMPRVGGDATLRALRRERADVTVLICSGAGIADEADRWHAAGAAGCVEKPFTIESLAAAVAAALTP